MHRCMAGHILHPPISAQPLLEPCRSVDGCGQWPIRTCRTLCCPAIGLNNARRQAPRWTQFHLCPDRMDLGLGKVILRQFVEQRKRRFVSGKVLFCPMPLTSAFRRKRAKHGTNLIRNVPCTLAPFSQSLRPVVRTTRAIAVITNHQAQAPQNRCRSAARKGNRNRLSCNGFRQISLHTQPKGQTKLRSYERNHCI